MLENGYVTLPRLFFRNWNGLTMQTPWQSLYDCSLKRILSRTAGTEFLFQGAVWFPVTHGWRRKPDYLSKRCGLPSNTLKRQGVWQRLHTQIVPYLRLKTSICFRQGQACGQTRGKPWTSQRQATGNRIRR